MEYRMEHDTMGQVAVPADKLWGAQTQRSLENFPIGEEKMPPDLIQAFGMIKWYDMDLHAKYFAQQDAYLGLGFD